MKKNRDNQIFIKLLTTLNSLRWIIRRLPTYYSSNKHYETSVYDNNKMT